MVHELRLRGSTIDTLRVPWIWLRIERRIELHLSWSHRRPLAVLKEETEILWVGIGPMLCPRRGEEQLIQTKAWRWRCAVRLQSGVNGSGRRTHVSGRGPMVLRVVINLASLRTEAVRWIMLAAIVSSYDAVMLRRQRR